MSKEKYLSLDDVIKISIVLNKNKLTVRDLLEVIHIKTKRAIPCNMNDQDLNSWWSTSKGVNIPILDMDLNHMINAFSKSLNWQEVYKQQNKLSTKEVISSVKSFVEHLESVNDR